MVELHRRSPTRRRSSASASTTPSTRPRPAWSRPRPTFFAKFAQRAAATGATVPLPAASEKVDYEAEVAFVVGRAAKDVAGGRGARPHRRLHAAQRPLRPRPPVRDAAVDARQGLRRLRSLRSGAGHPRRGRTPDAIGIALDLNGERMQEATTARPDLLDPRARRPPLDPDDPRARRHRLDRHPRAASAAPAIQGSGCRPGDETVVSSPPLGELRTPARPLSAA